MRSVKLLYVSALCSQGVFDRIFSLCHVKPRNAAQKYNGLLVEGLSREENGTEIETLSAIPVTYKLCKKRFLFFGKEKKGNVTYNHIPCVNFPILKEFMLIVYVLFKTIKWAIQYRKHEQVIICDVLNFSVSFSAWLVARMFRVKIVAVVTDIPSLMLITTRRSLRQRVYNWLSQKMINNYDVYVLLTEQMSEIIEASRGKYIVVEGLVDSRLAKVQNRLEDKWKNKSVVYAGGIYSEYGIKRLVEAFQGIEGDAYRLIFYGDGDMVHALTELCKLDARIEYRGVVTHGEIIKAQLAASVLVNPRLSDLGLSAYSFPSKNLEYMACGTPVLTTMLKGIPKEYFNFVYCINDESVEGMRKSLLDVLERSPAELHSFGESAQNFVITQKNHELQAKRVLDFIRMH